MSIIFSWERTTASYILAAPKKAAPQLPALHIRRIHTATTHVCPQCVQEAHASGSLHAKPSWDLSRKVSGGHGATLCLEKQSWNTSPGSDILLLPNDTDETRSGALCVTAVGTVLQPCDTPAQGQFQFQQEQQGQRPTL